MHKSSELMGRLHNENFASANNPDYNFFDEKTFTSVKKGVEFLPPGFPEHVTSRKTFDQLPVEGKEAVRKNFERNYGPVIEVDASSGSNERSMSIDHARIRYAKDALKSWGGTRSRAVRVGLSGLRTSATDWDTAASPAEHSQDDGPAGPPRSITLEKSASGHGANP